MAALVKRLYGEFRKVEENDDGTLTVAGVASSGARDEAGEVILPEAMKAALPDYMRFANIREMHDAKAAGVAVSADVDDDGFTNIETQIVDPVAITKVKTGVYKGFSIGGKVLARDPTDRSIITKIRLSEISLVDRPCNPDAMIGLWKAADVEPEGSDMAYAPTSDEVKALAEEMAKAAGKTGKANDFVVKAREKLIADHEAAQADLAEKRGRVVAEVKRQSPDLADEAVEKVANEAVFIADKPFDDQLETSVAEAIAKAVPQTTDGETGEADASASAEAASAGGVGVDVAEKAAGAEPVDAATALEAALEKAKDKKKPYGNVAYADAKNSKYPIDTEEHIRAAWSYINQAKNQKGYTAAEVKAIKDKIIAAWKDKIDADGPPSAEKMEAFGDLAKAAPALAALAKRGNPVLAKGLYTVGRLAELMQSMAYIQSSVAWETAEEGDQSTQPADAANVVAAMGALLVNMAQEEVSEVLQAYKDAGMDLDFDPGEDDVEIITYAAQLVDLCKADEAVMAKVGARHSKADMSNIQAAHDALAKVGAMCSPDNCPADDGETGKAAGLAAENERLNKAALAAAPVIEDLVKSRDEAREEITKLNGTIEDLTKRLETVEATPAAPKAAGSLHAVTKTGDITPAAGDPSGVSKDAVSAYLAGLSDYERNLLLTKAALGLPIAVERA